jgi:antitoxin YefM
MRSFDMKIYTASQAREDLYRLIDTVAQTSRPVCIMGRRNKVVMISQDDFNSIQETLYLLSIPGMKESILEGVQEDITQCSDTLDW